MRPLLVAALFVACGGRDVGVSATPSPVAAIVSAQLVRAGFVEIDRISRSCRSESLAEIVVVAGTGLRAGSDSAIHEVGCYALQKLRPPPVPHLMAPAVLQHLGKGLEGPQAVAALEAMLGDDTPCVPGRRTPAQVATVLLSAIPVAALREAIERFDVREESAGAPRGAHGALWMLGLFEKTRATEGARASRIDEMVAASTPDAFEALLAFLAAGSPWNDGRLSPTAGEAKEIDDHVQQALDWMELLAYKASPHGDTAFGTSEEWDCQLDVRQALATGTLGRYVLSSFEQLPSSVRSRLLSYLLRMPSTRPNGFDAWVAGLADHDPDPNVRSDARAFHKDETGGSADHR